MKIQKVTLFFVIFLVLPSISAAINHSKSNSSSIYQINLMQKMLPNLSGNWHLDFIHIDNNWSDTAFTYDWCTGLGTQNNPYLIENVTINGKQITDCIKIENSDDYFMIRNCSLYNSTDPIFSQIRASIKLNNVSNGIITENNCSTFNYFGIYCYDCEHIQILDNIVSDNVFGIELNKSKRCSIAGNTANYGTSGGINLENSEGNRVFENEVHFHNFFGILLTRSSKNNTISHNNVSWSIGGDGIATSDSFNNTFYDNYLGFNRIAIPMAGSKDSITKGNIVENNLYGIHLTNSSNNLFLENDINNNSNYGIYLWDIIGSCDNNIFQKNYIINNSIGGIYIDKPMHLNNLFCNNEFIANGFHVFDNGTDTTWDNGIIGNYWDNYTGMDLNDDGIGDLPYTIQNIPLRVDNFPIWDDGDDVPPDVTINSPSNGRIYNTTAPILNLLIYDFYSVHQAWYILNNTQTKYFFNPSIGINILEINQSAWNLLPEGDITVTIFVNDSANHITSVSINLIKNLVEEETPGISFGYVYIIILAVGIVSLLIETNRKKKS